MPVLEPLRKLSVPHLAEHSFPLRGKGAYWVALGNGREIVEGKLFLPEKKARDIMIFHPGFAGDGAKWFEEKHVKKFVEEGFAVLVLRHSGIALNHPNAGKYVHCPQRMQLAKREGEELLGDKPASLTTWSQEPLTAMRALGHSFDHIHLIGHSFGGLGTALALTQLKGAERERVGSWIGLSPSFLNKAKESPVVQGALRYFATLLPGISPNTSKEWTALSDKALKDAKKIPRSVRMLSYLAGGDEYNQGEPITAFLQRAGADEVRGFHFTERNGNYGHETEKHDFRDLSPGELIQFIRGERHGEKDKWWEPEERIAY